MTGQKNVWITSVLGIVAQTLQSSGASTFCNRQKDFCALCDIAQRLIWNV